MSVLLIVLLESLPVVLAALALYGVGTSTGMVTYTSLLQAEIPDRNRGRVFAGFDMIWQTGRLDFRPGITGPWQVQGRNRLDFTERCRLEISFFRRRSLPRELWLLVRTIPCVLRRTGVA